MIALYADENVDGRIVDGLRRRGVDVVTAQEVEMIGRIDDERHLEYATQENRALLTSDTDLLAHAHAWAVKGRPHAGVIYYHQRRCSVGQVVNEAFRWSRALAADDARNGVAYVAWDRRSRK